MSVGISRGPGWFPVAVQALVVLAESDELCSSSTMAQDLHAHAVFVRRVLTHLVRANLNLGVNAQVQATLDEIEAEAEQRLLEVLGHYTLASVLERVGIARRSS